MKNIILTIGITILKFFANLIYYIIKIFPIKNKIVMITRQSNTPTLDFKLLMEKIKNVDTSIKVEVLCNKVESNALYSSGILYKIKYIFYILKIMYNLATSKVCVVDGYCIPVCILKHKKNLKIIQIWHASGAVKKFGYQVLDKEAGSDSKIARLMCMHKNYDYIIAPSETTKDIFSEAFNTSKDKIVKLGLPRLEYIANSKYDKSEEIFKEYPKLREKKNILYIPTFRKNNNFNAVEKILECKLDEKKYNLIINLHPLDTTPVPEEYLVSKKYSSYDLIKIADYIITDYSALSIEASVLNKPIFVFLPDLNEFEEKTGLNINLKEELPSFAFENLSQIIDRIKRKEYNTKEIKEYKEKYIEIDENNTIKDLTQFILEIYKKGDKGDNKKNKKSTSRFSKEKYFF